ncbi:MAG: ABC transporter permease [Acidimicrobiia bacterium]|nr:ABC transporter permease [Acidimicrobiia bacterium]
MTDTANAATDLDPPPKVALPIRGLRQSVRELAHNRDILGAMVRREFATKYKTSFLGMLWSLLNPLFLVAIFTVVFGVVFPGMRSDSGISVPMPVFLFAGISLWNLFGMAVGNNVESVTGNGYLLLKVYFPREILPLSTVLSGLITYFFEFLVLVVALMVVGVYPYWTWLLAPVLVLVLAAMAFGLSLFVAAANVHFRDMQHFVALLLQALFWYTPIIYAFKIVADRGSIYETLWLVNPVAPIVVGFQSVMLDNTWPSLGWTLYSAGATALIVLLGYIFFNRQEPKFGELV